MRIASLALVLMLAACREPEPPRKAEPEKPNAAGLVALPCGNAGALRPVSKLFCTGKRHYMTPKARASLEAAASAMSPGGPILFMEASWPIGKKPMPPHFSHGDGRQVDLALFYETRDGRPLSAPPTPGSRFGYGAYEPPRRERDRVCAGVKSDHDRPDPPADRRWRLDEARTKELIRLLVADPNVRRVFVEPHLKTRLGFAGEAKVRFAGCRAARHDDHLHVDFLR